MYDEAEVGDFTRLTNLADASVDAVLLSLCSKSYSFQHMPQRCRSAEAPPQIGQRPRGDAHAADHRFEQGRQASHVDVGRQRTQASV